MRQKLFNWRNEIEMNWRVKNTTLNYIAYFLILFSTIARCASFSTFASLVGISIGITISAIGLNFCAINAVIQKSKSIIKKKNKKHDKIVLLAKSILNSMEVLSSKALIDSVISHDEFALKNNKIN